MCSMNISVTYYKRFNSKKHAAPTIKITNNKGAYKNMVTELLVVPYVRDNIIPIYFLCVKLESEFSEVIRISTVRLDVTDKDQHVCVNKLRLSGDEPQQRNTQDFYKTSLDIARQYPKLDHVNISIVTNYTIQKAAINLKLCNLQEQVVQYNQEITDIDEKINKLVQTVDDVEPNADIN